MFQILVFVLCLCCSCSDIVCATKPKSDNVVQVAKESPKKEVAFDQKIPSGLKSENEIVAVVYGTNSTDIILQTDVDAAKKETRTLDDIILEKLMYQDACRYKIDINDDAIDRHLSGLCNQPGVTRDELEKIFRQSGYSYAEAVDRIRVGRAIEVLTEHKIRSRLVVLEKDVIAYCEANPEIEFTISKAIVPFDSSKSKSSQLDELKKAVRTNNLKGIKFDSPYSLMLDEIVDSKKFITKMKPGSVSQPSEVKGGFEIVKLVKRSERSVQDRYREVDALLKKPKFDEMLEAYKKDLKAAASVVYY